MFSRSSWMSLFFPGSCITSDECAPAPQSSPGVVLRVSQPAGRSMIKPGPCAAGRRASGTVRRDPSSASTSVCGDRA
jgi:hypothetical protein